MSKATFTFGRFNVPTENGHGKLISRVQAHAEESGGSHYIFPSHSQDNKKNPLSHGEKVGFMRRLFPSSNIVSSGRVRTAIDAMKHLEKKGHTHVTMVVGSDRVSEFSSLLNKYRKKEFPGIKKVSVVSAGQRDPDAEGAEGESASKHRAMITNGQRNKFISKYSDRKLGAAIHDAAKKGMQMEYTNPIGIFLLGGPGSGKDYVLTNIFSRFNLTEVQLDQVLNGKIQELIELNQNIVINGAADIEKVELVKNILEGYTFDTVYVSVSNKISRARNQERENPLPENKRLEKWYRAEKLAEELDCFIFNNSINLSESSQMEQIVFGSQIEKLLERLTSNGLLLSEKTFKSVPMDKDSGLPKKYVSGLSTSTALARKAHWKRKSKLSDSDPRAYEPAPGDANAKTKPSRHTLAVRKMMDESEQIDEGGPGLWANIHAKRQRIKRGSGERMRKVGDKGAPTPEQLKSAKNEEIQEFDEAQKKLRPSRWRAEWRLGTQSEVDKNNKKIYDRLAKTDPDKAKAFHDNLMKLRKEELDQIDDINSLFEMQLAGTDEYRKHAIAMTPGQGEIGNVNKSNKSNKNEEHKDCGTTDCCGECESVGEAVREDSESIIDATPTLDTETKKRKRSQIVPPNSRDIAKDGPAVITTGTYVREAAKPLKSFMKTPRQLPGPPGGHSVPPGYERVKSWGGAYELRKIKEKPTTVKEAVEYHIENQVSFTDNIFRPGSDMFFKIIEEAKKLYAEGKYTPADEYEQDMLNSNIGEKATYNDQEVILDYPFEEELNEADDPTDGKGIGKPFRSGGGGAVYVRVGDGVRKINFSQSGMQKKYMDPGATRSFVARHHCLTNKDKTSASYWACRWPRFFSNSGKIWW